MTTPSPEPPPMLTVPAVARALDVSTRTVRRMIGRGELPAVKVSRDYRVEQADLETWKRTHRASA